MQTVGDYIRKLQEFPENWPVQVSTPAGGDIAIEHREIKGNPVIKKLRAVFFHRA